MEPVEAALDQLFLATWDQYNQRNRPEVVYHYTSAEGLCGILSTKQLFASDLFCLNDPSEFQYGKKVIVDALRTRSDRVSQALVRNFEHEPLFPHVGKNWSLYSISFCGTKDLLGQWRGYGGTGGYAVGIKLSALLKENGKRFALHRMMYEEQEQRNTIDGLVSKASELFEGHANDQNKDYLLNEVGTRLVMSIFNLKHPSFRGEDEWRIVMLESFDNPDYPVQFRIAGARIVPYVKFHFDADWIDQVVLGPTVAAHPNERAIRTRLVTGGFQHGEVVLSRIPFRD